MASAAGNVVSFSDSLTPADELGAEITELCSYLHAAEFKLLSLIRRFDENEYWAEQGFCSCAHWLNFHCGIGLNAGREKVRVAHALAGLPKISAEFERGALSFSKVRAMTRIADASNEEYLLMVATHGTAHHVERLVAKFRRAKRLEEAEFANEQYRQREVTHYYDHDGSLVIKGRIPAEQGALIVKALEMAMDRQFKEGADNSAGQPDDEPEEREPIAARRADALAEVAETYLNNSESSGSTADRYQVVVHVRADQESVLEDGSDESGTTSHIEDGPHVTAVTSERVACDCSIVAIKEDENGEPLSIGRRSRSIPAPMRRALQARDKRCRFPGCTHTRFVDGHHIKHWAAGGETSLDNLVLLCRHHHHLVHEGGFVCEKSETGEVTFRDQRKLKSDPCHAPICTSSSPPDDELQQWLDKNFLEKDIDACAARWYAGENIDWHMAVSALL